MAKTNRNSGKAWTDQDVAALEKLAKQKRESLGGRVWGQA